MKLNKALPVNQRKAIVYMDEKTESFEEREKAINAIVHEIRNPLTAIKLTNQLMQQIFEKDERDKFLAESYIMIIARNIEKIEDHLRKAMTYKSRKVALGPVNVAESIDKALFEAKDRLYLSGITVGKSYKGSHWVYGNEEKLMTVFLNIIVNAVEAIKKENGRLWISVYEANNTIRITFKDNGIGMQPSTAERIFDANFSTKDGIGIGLSNVKEIMNLHKASIVTDSLPGIGTSISLLFNSIPEHEVSAKLRRVSGPIVDNLEPLNIP